MGERFSSVRVLNLCGVIGEVFWKGSVPFGTLYQWAFSSRVLLCRLRVVLGGEGRRRGSRILDCGDVLDRLWKYVSQLV